MAGRGGRRVSVVLAVACAIGTGCGGGDNAPTRAQFVKSANAVCKSHHVKISAAAAKLLAGGKLPSPSEFGRLAQGTIIPQYSAQIADLRKLDPSAKEAAAFRAWLDDSQALRTRLQRNPALIQRPGNLAAVNGQADRLGLSSDCHVGPS